MSCFEVVTACRNVGALLPKKKSFARSRHGSTISESAPRNVSQIQHVSSGINQAYATINQRTDPRITIIAGLA